jgi:hypothetical protein
MQAVTTWALFAESVLFASGVGNVTILPHLVVHKEFLPHQFAGIVSVLAATLQVTYAFAPSVLGALRDVTGNCQAALILCFALQLTAADVILGGRQRHVAPAEAPAEA